MNQSKQANKEKNPNEGPEFDLTSNDSDRLKQQLKRSISTAKRTVKNIKFIEEYRSKIDETEESIRQNDDEEYEFLLLADKDLYRQAIVYFENDRNKALKDFLNLAHKIEEQVM